MVQKLSAIVCIKAQDGEREGAFDILDLVDDILIVFAPDCTLLCPAGCDIDTVDRIGLQAFCRASALGNGIGLQEARPGLVPLIGFDGDMFS